MTRVPDVWTLVSNVFLWSYGVNAKTFQNNTHTGTKYCHLHIYMYWKMLLYTSKNNTQCKLLNPAIILHLVTLWESLSYTVTLAHKESPQQEVGRSEGWQPLLWAYG